MRFALLCLLLVGLGSTASAHHAFNADFDRNVTGAIEGVLEEVFFRNPHARYFISVTKEDGSDEVWDAEGYALGIMTRSGFTAETLTIGERVTVFGNMGRDGRRMIAIQWLEKEDGTVLEIFGR